MIVQVLKNSTTICNLEHTINENQAHTYCSKKKKKAEQKLTSLVKRLKIKSTSRRRTRASFCCCFLTCLWKSLQESSCSKAKDLCLVAFFFNCFLLLQLFIINYAFLSPRASVCEYTRFPQQNWSSDPATESAPNNSPPAGSRGPSSVSYFSFSARVRSRESKIALRNGSPPPGADRRPQG